MSKRIVIECKIKVNVSQNVYEELTSGNDEQNEYALIDFCWRNSFRNNGHRVLDATITRTEEDW